MTSTTVHQGMRPETAIVIGCVAFTIAIAMFAGAMIGGLAQYDSPFVLIGAFTSLVMCIRYWSLWIKNHRAKARRRDFFGYEEGEDKS